MRLRRHQTCTMAAWVVAALLLPAAAWAVEDNPDCEPNPLFGKFKGEVLGSCERARFSELALYRGKISGNPQSEPEEFKAEGEYWSYFDEIPADAKGRYPGTTEVRRNFENVVRAMKGEILLLEQSKVTWRLRKEGAEFVGESGCGAGDSVSCTAIAHKFVRTSAMEQSVTISAERIGEGLLAEGKVIFYGIYFDTDKAVVKAESAPTLAEIAKWLASNPKAEVYVVGHTDGTGALERNKALSRDRAAAVLAYLAEKHGIARTRLVAEGVGPLSPVASNASEAGRAKNRRVELVLR